MAKLGIAPLMVVISLIATIPFPRTTQSFEVENWANKLDAAKETVTNIQFYFHDTVSGKSPSAIRVAQATNTEKSPTLFGALLMADDPLTETPDPKSKLLGRAQGLYGSACQEELGLIMVMNFGFTEGVYKGSSISILGKNSALNSVREMPIVGGTGLFRFARGYALAQTHWFDIATGDAIVGYNVTVVH
nr:dirigent protein 23-like [Ziziphus jujuba var. spinosa]